MKSFSNIQGTLMERDKELIHFTIELRSVGIPYYNPDALLRYNHGVSFEDDYWINFDDEKKTFEQVRFK